MADSQRGERDIDIVESRKELNAVADNIIRLLLKQLLR